MFPSSSELQVLLSCASTVPNRFRVRELVRNELDWEWIVSRAESYSLAPLIYTALRELTLAREIPSDVAEKLRLEYRRCYAAGINRMIKMREILSAFSRQGIPVILLKGAAVAVTVYRSVGLRPMLDVDLLVRVNDLDRAAKILQCLGYFPDESYQTAQWYRTSHHHLVPYVAPDRTLSVELHQHIIPRRAAVNILPKTFWEHTQTIQVASETALVLEPAHLLLSVCLHVALGQYFERSLRDIVDIAEILRHHETKIDWDVLLREVLSRETARSLYYSLWLVESITGEVVPKAILRKVKSQSQCSFLVNACLKFLIPRAVFPDFTHLPAPLIRHAIRALLHPHQGRKRLTTLLLSLASQVSESRFRRRAKESATSI